MENMKKLILTILFLLFSTIAWAGSSVTFTWQPNSESDLKEYRLYQADISGDYELGVDIPVAITPAGTETATIHDVADGTWFWVMTASDHHGNESGESDEVTKGLDTIAPNAVEGVSVTATVTVDVVIK